MAASTSDGTPVHVAKEKVGKPHKQRTREGSKKKKCMEGHLEPGCRKKDHPNPLSTLSFSLSPTHQAHRDTHRSSGAYGKMNAQKRLHTGRRQRHQARTSYQRRTLGHGGTSHHCPLPQSCTWCAQGQVQWRGPHPGLTHWPPSPSPPLARHLHMPKPTITCDREAHDHKAHIQLKWGSQATRGKPAGAALGSRGSQRVGCSKLSAESPLTESHPLPGHVIHNRADTAITKQKVTTPYPGSGRSEWNLWRWQSLQRSCPEPPTSREPQRRGSCRCQTQGVSLTRHIHTGGITTSTLSDWDAHKGFVPPKIEYAAHGSCLYVDVRMCVCTHDKFSRASNWAQAQTETWTAGPRTEEQARTKLGAGGHHLRLGVPSHVQHSAPEAHPGPHRLQNTHGLGSGRRHRHNAQHKCTP